MINEPFGFAEYLRVRFPADITGNSCLGSDGEQHLRACVWVCLADVREHDKPHFIETGTHKGVSAALLAQFGHVTTIDKAACDHDPESGHGIGMIEKFTQEELWKSLGANNRITARAFESDEGKAEFIARHVGEYDVAFIDGDHTLAGVALDWRLLQHTGRVIFHDYKPDVPCHRDAVCTLVDQIDDAEWHKHFFPNFAVVIRKRD